MENVILIIEVTDKYELFIPDGKHKITNLYSSLINLIVLSYILLITVSPLIIIPNFKEKYEKKI